MATALLPAPQLLSLIEQLPGCRLLIDADYRVVAVNAAYRACCGRGRPAVGLRCYEVSHGYDAPCDQRGESCPLQAAAASGHAEHCVHIHHGPAGAEHVEVELTPLRDGAGEVTHYVERIDRLSPAVGEDCVGREPAFLKTLGLIKRVAPSDTAVLLLGETGTGKEVLARTVHELSDRARGPFVVVDCAGLAESLFESELFGHERGAFTGAAARKPGLVEMASGGTLFVDEIGDIPLPLQVKLLRVLETGLFRRVGGTDMRRTDFRLVAATHRDLAAGVAAGQFRADLYYRISTFPVRVPPLRDRPGDVPLLARAMLSRLGRREPLRFTDAALDALARYAYPGNVRELRNVVERAAVLADAGLIGVAQLPDEIRGHAAGTAAGCAGDLLQRGEREALLAALRETGGHRRELAQRLGISERTVYRKLRQHGLA